MSQIILDKEKIKVETPLPLNKPEHQEEVARITKRMNEMSELQGRVWREFNERTLKQYQDDNQKRANNYVEPRSDDIDDWQTRGFEGITREKMFAFTAKVAMRRPQYKFKAVKQDGAIDRLSAEVVEDFYDYSWEYEDPTGVQFFFDAWEAAGSGTVIRWEGVEQYKEEYEDFDEYDVTTGELKGLKTIETKSEVNCKSRRVSLKHFFVSDWYEPNIQNQPAIAEVQIMNRAKFDRTYGHYMNADRVPELSSRASWEYDDSFYMEQWEGVDEEMVHVTHFYSKENGKCIYRIVANGVLILATPSPRKDGKYPYTKGIFKPHANSDFFYGKALPDEIASDQDVYNAFKNMVIDRSILYVQRPMITDGGGEVEDDILGPNKLLNIKGNITTLDIAPVGQADMAMLEYLRGSADRQTSDSAQSGYGGTGVTAREIVIADENARKLAGIFRLFLEDFDLGGARLRVANILQFYFEPIKTTEILSDKKTEDIRNAYKMITLDDRKLSDGKTGTKVVSVYGTKEELPTRDELDIQEEVAKLQGMEVEKVAITSEYIRNINLNIAIIPESSFEQSRSLKLALEVEYIQTIGQFFPQKLQEYGEALFRNLNEVYDKDPTLFEQKEQQQPQQLPQEAMQGMPQGQDIAGQLAQTEAPSLGQVAGLSV